MRFLKCMLRVRFPGKAAEMLGIPRLAFYQLLSEKRVSLPEKLNQSILKELKKLETKKG